MILRVGENHSTSENYLLINSFRNFTNFKNLGALYVSFSVSQVQVEELKLNLISNLIPSTVLLHRRPALFLLEESWSSPQQHPWWRSKSIIKRKFSLSPYLSFLFDFQRLWHKQSTRWQACRKILNDLNLILNFLYILPYQCSRRWKSRITIFTS